MDHIQAIVVVGAYPHLRGGVWRTSGVDDPGDHAGATFDRFRVLAASVLAQKHPEVPLILSGGAQNAESPSCAAVLKAELTELGVSPSRMIMEERSRSVHQQLYEVGKIVAEHRFGHVLVITNDWHHPRLRVMMEHAPKLEMWKTLSWEKIDAEEVMLGSSNAEWSAMVDAERSHPKFTERIAMERRGAEQVKDGSYKYTSFESV